MAKTKAQAWMIQEEDLTELEDLQRELRDRVDKSGGNGAIYMMQLYTQFLNIVNIEVRRVRARFDREVLAEMRRTQRELKLEARERAANSEG